MQLLKVFAAYPLKLKYNTFTEIDKEYFFINYNLNYLSYFY